MKVKGVGPRAHVEGGRNTSSVTEDGTKGQTVEEIQAPLCGAFNVHFKFLFLQLY